MFLIFLFLTRFLIQSPSLLSIYIAASYFESSSFLFPFPFPTTRSFYFSFSFSDFYYFHFVIRPTTSLPHLVSTFILYLWSLLRLNLPLCPLPLLLSILLLLRFHHLIPRLWPVLEPFHFTINTAIELLRPHLPRSLPACPRAFTSRASSAQRNPVVCLQRNGARHFVFTPKADEDYKQSDGSRSRPRNRPGPCNRPGPSDETIQTRLHLTLEMTVRASFGVDEASREGKINDKPTVRKRQEQKLLYNRRGVGGTLWQSWWLVVWR